MDELRYGFLRPEDVSTKEGRSGAAFPDHLNPSPAYAKARADAKAAAEAKAAALSPTLLDPTSKVTSQADAMASAFDEERMRFMVDHISYYIASDRFEHRGTIRWTLRPDDHRRAATLAIHPLPYMSIEDLLRAGIVDWHGVVEEAWKKECEERRL